MTDSEFIDALNQVRLKNLWDLNWKQFSIAIDLLDIIKEEIPKDTYWAVFELIENNYRQTMEQISLMKNDIKSTHE